jgi:ubiquinone/menaquinone biosynthesis C-methylase UbiE
MSEPTIPDRMAWAIEVLAIEPDDHVLEIGSGRGVAVEAISRKLGTGTITAMDRSATAVDAARARNADAVASGKVRLHSGALSDADLPQHAVTQAFAIDVNLFWVRDPAPELARITRSLATGGKLFLFYEPPTSARARDLGGMVRAVLERNGYATDVLTATTSRGASLVCVIGSPS